MNVVEINVDDLIPYENNPRKNDDAVEKVALSISAFGFKVPIVIDKDNVIVCGHTRLKAAKKLGLKTVPCIKADDLSDEQIKAFRLADNKTGELASLDWDQLRQELEDIKEISMDLYGFDDNDRLTFSEYFNDPSEDEKKKTVTCEHLQLLRLWSRLLPEYATRRFYTSPKRLSAVNKYSFYRI